MSATRVSGRRARGLTGWKRLSRLALLLPVLLGLLNGCAGHRRVTVGSKAFAESWILGEALTLLGESAGEVRSVTHAASLGGTDVVYKALLRGDVDVYPEYTGTILEAILKSKERLPLDRIRGVLQSQGVGVSGSLGFNDGYGIAVTQADAQRYGLRRISDLAAHPELKLAFSHEFLERKDGWPGLAREYGLRFGVVRAIQHDVAYEALASGQVDATDIYTTDAQIERLKLRILEDDRAFFPRYDCVLLYRLDLPRRAPRTWRAMERLVGRIPEAAMIRANAAVTLRHVTQEAAAVSLLRETLGSVPLRLGAADTALTRITRDTLQHLKLVGISLGFAALIGIPLGIVATRSAALGAVVLSATGVLQTVPSLALLAFMIPLLGIGELPAVVALFLYSLLPIVRNTYVGLTGIPPNLSEAAEALGLSTSTQLLRIRLPLAAPSIMAGLKTSAVINVGTATLGTLIGAGGLGDPIWRGMQTRNTPLILEGVLPAIVLALLVQLLFDRLDRLVVPKGLRITPARD